MASPHVAGAAALVMATGRLGPNPKPAAVEHLLESTSRDLGAPGFDNRYGNGLLDVAAALRDPAAPPAPPASRRRRR